MTAKHRKGKSNHKQEDNFFKSEILETEVRPSGSNHTPLLVFVLVFVVGCFTGAWFFFQQHLTLTDLTDNVMGIQVKIAKLQSSHEELRLSYTKVKIHYMSSVCQPTRSDMHLMMTYLVNALQFKINVSENRKKGPEPYTSH